MAGWSGGPLFTQPARWLLRRATRSVPRLVNIVAHKSLISAYGRGSHRVSYSDVRAAARDTASLQGTGRGRAIAAWWLLAAGGAAAAAWAVLR